MYNESKPSCFKFLWLFLKSVFCCWYRWRNKWDAIKVAIALIALWQVPGWLGNQQTSYKELRSMADAVEKSFDEKRMQAYSAVIPERSGEPSRLICGEVKFRMKLALLVITNDFSTEELRQACECATNKNSDLIVQSLGKKFYELNEKDMAGFYDFLFGADHFNMSGKIRLQESYFVVQKYLDVFEFGWVDNKENLIEDRDWRDWLQYLNAVTSHPLFQLAVEQNTTNYSKDFIAVARNPKAEIKKVKWRIKHPFLSWMKKKLWD